MKMYKTIIFLFLGMLAFTACDEALTVEPSDNRVTEAELFQDPATYRGIIAKAYAGLAVGGQAGGDGDADISGIDGGFSNYHRLYWNMQELTTDEAIIAWNDGTIKDLHGHVWTDGNEFINAMFSRINYQIAVCNEFLELSTDAKLDEYNIPNDIRASVAEYRAEARFLRAYSYYHGMDLFGKMPFREAGYDPAVLPEVKNRAELFEYIESELLAIEDDMVDARMNEYGRADKAAVWMTLAKIYLNSEVYTGTARNTEAITQLNKVITAGYTVPSVPYAYSFYADNNRNGAESEFIWTINFDGLNTQTFGGTTYLTHAPVGGSMDPTEFGINGGWGGIRTTPEFVELFPNEENSADMRETFYTDGQTKEIPDVGQFTDGFAIQKFKNINVDGTPGSDSVGDFVDIDFPVYRLSDAYLMYAEAVVRGGSGGDLNTAESYINLIRERAYGDTSGNISAGQIDLQFIIDERARELHWESHRRQDLIRFNQFSSNKVWAWKGNVPSGTVTAPFRNLLPIPAQELNQNPNLQPQNTGY
ncbi:RagB/SusD family nutrient uptake outer membrane protein [Nonlabens dokdonensis]|uniref:Outer membrane protein n=2 Tax=Nonlabens dokdonensis TaxID=328515 RepID=L7WB22_NONDD|nr:RagB/SusD family nutrient uptake outer membrane protein [Nonlabens dokdonensis]AGC76113.1 outer membrane protein [Nonlabens dokdonensis DSW-6]